MAAHIRQGKQANSPACGCGRAYLQQSHTLKCCSRPARDSGPICCFPQLRPQKPPQPPASYTLLSARGQVLRSWQPAQPCKSVYPAATATRGRLKWPSLPKCPGRHVRTSQILCCSPWCGCCQSRPAAAWGPTAPSTPQAGPWTARPDPASHHSSASWPRSWPSCLRFWAGVEARWRHLDPQERLPEP